MAPVGGGGLLAGIGTVIAARRPDVRVIGVEPARAACLTAAFDAGRPVQVRLSPTLADGLAVAQLGARPYEILKRVVHQVVTVDEAAIALAVLRLIELEKSVVEGAGAAPLAAFLAGKLASLEGERVVLVAPEASRGWPRSSPRRERRSRRSSTTARSRGPICRKCVSSASSRRPGTTMSPRCTAPSTPQESRSSGDAGTPRGSAHDGARCGLAL